MLRNPTLASWAHVWDGPAQKTWCAVNLGDTGSALRPQLKSRRTCLSVQLPSLSRRQDRFIAVKPTAHIWLQNVAFYVDSNKSLVCFVLIITLVHPHAGMATFPQPATQEICVFTLPPASPSPHHPPTTGTDTVWAWRLLIPVSLISALFLTSDRWELPLDLRVDSLWLLGFIFWSLPQLVSICLKLPTLDLTPQKSPF